MLAVLKQNPLALLLAVVLHLLLAVFLVVGVDWQDKPKGVPATANVVQAKVIDAKQLQTEIDRIKQAEDAKKARAVAAKREEERKLAELKKRREAEKKRLAEIERERKQREKAEAKKQAEEKKRAEAEKQRIAALEKKKAELKKKQEAEKKRLAELERKRKAEEQARVAAEKKRKAEEEKRRKAEAERERREAEAARQREIARKKAEAAARAKAEAAAREAELQAQFAAEQDASERGRLIALIREKVQRNWLQPPGTATAGLSCSVQVRLGPSGSVLLANVVQSSGNGAFDRSVEAAVRKSDPLPMPESPRLQAEFRNLTFVFDPQE